MGVNNIVVTGRLGRDADSAETKSGMTRLKFSIAHSRKFTREGERVENTSWIPVSYYGKPAEAIEKYLLKGKEVTVVGRLDVYEYEKDGDKRKGFEVIANEVWLGGEGKTSKNSDSSDDSSDDDDKQISKKSSSTKRGKSDEDSPW